MQTAKHSRALLVLSALLLSASLVFRIPATASAEADPLLVIASLAFPKDDISLADLKNAFRGRLTIVAGKTIVPFNHNLGAPMRVEFDRLVLGLEPAAVGNFWVDLKIRDEGRPPRIIPTPDLAARVVAALPTAITYVQKHMLNPKVKALTIDGKSPGQPGYALAPSGK